MVHGNSSSTHPTLNALTAEPSVTTIDVLAWLGRATLDVIGEAGMIAISIRLCPQCPFLGFGYALNALPPPGADPRGTNKSESELARAFAIIFTTQQQFCIFNVLAIWFPFLRRFVRPHLQPRLSFECLWMSSSAQSPALCEKPKLQCSA